MYKRQDIEQKTRAERLLSNRNKSKGPREVVLGTVGVSPSRTGHEFLMSGSPLTDIEIRTKPTKPPIVQLDWAALRNKFRNHLELGLKDAQATVKKVVQLSKESKELGTQTGVLMVDAWSQCDSASIPVPVRGCKFNQALQLRFSQLLGKERDFGTCLAVLGAKEAQDTAKVMVSLAGHSSEVYLFAYTYDRAELTEMLLIAHTAGAKVRIAMDEGSLQGRTRDMPQQALRLLQSGIEVRSLKGRSVAEEYAAVGRGVASHITGIQHSKCILVDDYLLAGSCNWTTSSRANFETCCLIRLEGDGVARAHEFLTDRWAQGVPMDAEKLRKDCVGSPSARSSWSAGK